MCPVFPLGLKWNFISTWTDVPDERRVLNHRDPLVESKGFHLTAGKEILTAKEVASLLKCSVAMVYRLRESGELPESYKLFGGEKGFRWERAEVSRYLESKRTTISLTQLAPPGFRPIQRLK
jgi:excisionase family DNA binding protein